ncbi:MAG: trypsin-like peptidase domain-containing protein [Elusimicrobia bacterium]|nr:trypsin-like peptidase domain-containing protein [Elusimicrobiota bacterium]
MKRARAALALLLAVAIPVRAETTTDPLWYLLSTYVLAPDARAVEAPNDGPADEKGLAALQADLSVLTDGFEGFRNEAQVKEALERLKPRMSPELRPFFENRGSSLDVIYRTLAVTDYTWAQRFPEPPCDPLAARRKLLAARDGLFQNEKGEASPWLVALLGPQAEGKSAEQALDQASSQAKLTGADYEKLRARVRKLTMALASDKAVGAARSKLYCSRAAAFEGLAAAHRAKDATLISAGRAVSHNPEESVFVVVWKDQRAAATLLRTKSGAVLVTDAAVVADTDHPYLFAYAGNAKPLSLTATVVRRHPELGVAVLSYAEDLARPALALSGETPAKDDLVAAVGHTSVSGLWTKTSGLVTKIGEASFQTDAAISPELSGGPVLNEAGEVAGLLVQRPADTEEGRWPVAIPAPILVRWLDDPASSLSSATTPEVIEDAGTAAILTRALSSPLTEAGLGAWNIPNLPPPPSVPRGVCVQNCGGGSSSGSSYSGSYADNGSAELGKALGELGAVLILKGIPALFRGIGKLFKKNGVSTPKAPAIAKAAPAPKTESTSPPPPPPPPKPTCELMKIGAPKKAGVEPFEVAVAVSCKGGKVPLSGHSVKFTFEWDGNLSTQTVTVITDESGLAPLVMQVSNDETKVEKVRNVSQRSHDELDHYDPEQRDPEEPAEPKEDESAPAPSVTSQDNGLITASDTVTIAKTTTAATAAAEAEEAIAASMAAARTARIANAVRAGGIFKLGGNGKVLRVIATFTLSGTAATVVGAAIVVITVKQTFEIGWAIGTVAEGKISEIQRGLKQYDQDSKASILEPESHGEGIPEPDSPVITSGKWQCKAICNVQVIGKTKCPERVYGRGGSSSEESACREAKRNATQSTPRGCYPRHCRCDCGKS